MNDKLEDILNQLDREREKRPDLAQIIDLHRDLIAARAGIEVPPIKPELNKEEAEALLAKGRCLLDEKEVELPEEELAGLCAQICDIVAHHRPDLSDQISAIRAHLAVPARFKELVTQYLNAGGTELTQEGEIDGELLAFVLNQTLHPFLENYAQALQPLLDGTEWISRTCPVCGGQADFSYLSEENGARYLLCSRCDTEWSSKRLECPFCGNSDSKTWGYYPDEDGSYRLYVCDQCNHYLKTLDRRERSPDTPLVIERIVTVAMDLAARERGYN